MLSYGYFDRLSYVYQTLENAAAVTPFVSGNEINYPQIFNAVTVRFTCMSGRMKEEIVFSQTARDSLINPSRYGLSPKDTYLIFAAEIDLWPGNIKAMAQTPSGKVPIKNGNSFAFNGTDPIDFEDAQENLYFSLPSDYAWAANDNTGENVVSVFRVFYTQQGRHYLLLGVPWSWVNDAPKGPLVIDPTVTIDNSSAFRDTRLENATNYGSDITLMVGKRSGSDKKRTIIKLDLSGSGIPPTATILNSQLQLYYYDAQGSAWADRWVQAHQVLKAWAEDQANRDNRQTGFAWGAQYAALDGTDVSASMESTMLFQSGETGTWKSWNLTALTQKMTTVVRHESFY